LIVAITTISIAVIAIALYVPNQSSSSPSQSQLSLPPGANPNPSSQAIDIEFLNNLVGVSPPLGSDDSPITLYEFGEYQCPNCLSWWRNVKPQLVSEFVDTGRVKVLFVDFPFFGPDSFTASQAAKCAGDQGRYWEYHDILYAEQGAINSGWAGADNLKRFASDLGLDIEVFNTCLDSGKYTDIVEQSFEEGVRLGVAGTPTFVVVGPGNEIVVVTGPQPLRAFERIFLSMLSG